MKEHNNFSYLWKFEPDIPNSFEAIVFEKSQTLQRMYELINFCHPVILQFLIAAIFFVTDCKERKLEQTAQFNQVF